jgi:NADH:ubiquinone oxidoreductase subunit 5 (subunit L)/multisubunit Na+/H+ antiporter MnhA subunit
MSALLIPIFFPLLVGVLSLAISERTKYLREVLAILASLTAFVVALVLFKERAAFVLPWAGFGFEFSLRLNSFSAFILSSVTGFGLLIALYSAAFMSSHPGRRWYFFYLLATIGFASGAVLANNLVLLLFFWEGLLITLYTFIALGGKGARATAMKAFLIVAVCDLCLLVGAGIAANIAKTMDMSAIKIQVIGGWATVAFILMMIGAISKGGAMPFHSWIPDAAIDAPLPVMAFLPGALEKLLGVYLLARICLDLFVINLPMQLLLMAIGSITILLAVAMALVQKDYKKLLSYHAISQFGYMVLGIGTGNPIGIAGALFHMVNNAIYKCCLFLSGGAVERKAGTTDITNLGGLRRNMPITATCFVIAAASISGIPPFNGFFSKELVVEGALHTGYTLFYWAGVVGSILTLASFLKLGHSVYFGERPKAVAQTREAEWPMLVPMVFLSALCLLFGFGAKIPLAFLIQPSLEQSGIVPEAHLWGFHPGFVFTVAMAALMVAILNHVYGWKRTGKPQKAVDHIHYAPGLEKIYDLAARRYFDPYEYGLKFVYGAGRVLFWIDRGLDWLTDTFPTKLVLAFSGATGKAHNGLFPNYLAWAILGLLLFAIFVGYSGGLP